MTNAFDWRNKPSKISEELRKDYVRSQNARNTGKAYGKAITVKETLEPRRFHVYSKAGVK